MSITIATAPDDPCDPETAPATVTVDPEEPVVASSTSLVFTSCGTPQSVTFRAPASATPGSYNVAIGADASYNVIPSSVTVNVVAPSPPPDRTPPVLSLPGNITAEATSGSGAAVFFTASATDAGTIVPVSCSPSSGSTFPIEPSTTMVNCNATDSSSNTATGSFQVTVWDTQAPVVTVPSGVSAEATSPAGAVLTFSASANDVVDGNRTVTCDPMSSGSTFPVGTTALTCSATDTRGNRGSGTFSITVTDAGPTVVVPPTQTVEATGPSGAPVTYTPAPSASDVVDGPLPVTCSKASGVIFALGQTTVTCTAADSRGTPATAAFQVVVVDRTPPVVTAPPPASFVAEGNSLSRSSPALAAYLARGRAADLVDPNPVLHVDAPLFFPLGPTVVTYTAIDGSGNRDSETTTITIVPPPPPGQRPPTPPPDDPPPANVTSLRARPGNALMRLSWTAPRDADVVRYAAFRSERTGLVVQVYGGAATGFVDRGLVNGVEYRYVVVAYDRAGHRSVGVAVLATPRQPMLLAPRDGARVARGTLFSWRRVAGARYYNFQLFRVVGAERRVKVLSVWPVTNRFRLRATWRFGSRTHRLLPGTYRWYVWPGFGSRADVRYGELLGERTFAVTSP